MFWGGKFDAIYTNFNNLINKDKDHQKYNELLKREIEYVKRDDFIEVMPDIQFGILNFFFL